MARRSALPGAQHLLETSLNHLYYEALPTVRPEDWHRGLPILLLSFWARRFAGSEIWMRVPHLLWVAAWLIVQALLLRLAAPKASLEWMLIGCLSFLLTTEGRSRVFQRAFLDDVPAAVFALAGVYVFARDGVTRRSAVLLGILWGLAAFCKDALLLSGAIGVVLLAFGQWSGERHTEPLRFPAAVGLFCAAFALTLLPRFLWGFVDYGTFLQNPIRHWLVAHYFGKTYPYPEHFPYFLTGDTKYLSRLQMAGGLRKALLLILIGPMRETFFVLLSFVAVWAGLRRDVDPIALRGRAVAARPRSHRRRLCDLARLLRALLRARFRRSVADPLLVGSDHPRLGPDRCEAGRVAARRRSAPPACGDPVVLVLAIALVMVNVRPVRQLQTGLMATPEAPLSDAMSRAVHARLGSAESVVMEIRPGIFYWSNHPENRVVAFPSKLFRSIGPDQTRRFLDLYEMRYVVCDAGGAEHRALEDLDFSEILRINDEALFEVHSDLAEPSAARR